MNQIEEGMLGDDLDKRRESKDRPLSEIWPKPGEAIRITNERLAKDGRSSIPEGGHIDVILKSELQKGRGIDFDEKGKNESLETVVAQPIRSGDVVIVRTAQATYTIEKLPKSALN